MLAAAIGALAGCGTPSILQHADVKTVQIDGSTVWVAPMPDKGSWGATRYPANPLMPINPVVEKLVLQRAIEQVTKCTVVESQFEERTANLYVIVRC